jgi:GxxExxY protein
MEKEIIYKEESYNIISACMEVHNKLGNGFLEIVYKDALEYEFLLRKIPYKREKSFDITYKDKQLPHKYNADFIIYDKIVLEVKAVSEIIERYFRQTLNYLKVTKFKLGIIVNFGEESLKYKRVVF